MTFNQFLTELTVEARKYPQLKWEVRSDDHRDTFFHGEIRYRIRTLLQFTSCCPICFLYWAKTGFRYEDSSFIEAGEKLGLSFKQTRFIARCSDDLIVPTEKPRLRILKAVGLEHDR